MLNNDLPSGPSILAKSRCSSGFRRLLTANFKKCASEEMCAKAMIQYSLSASLTGGPFGVEAFKALEFLQTPEAGFAGNP